MLTARFAIYAAFALALLVIALHNIDTMLIEDRITDPATAVFAVASLALPGHRWFDGLLGAAAGYAVPWIASRCDERLCGRSGFGAGIYKLLAMVGALLGWRAAIATLFAASMIGTVTWGAWAVWQGIRGAWRSFRDRLADRDLDGTAAPDAEIATEVAFAPFIAIAAIASIVVEPWFARV